MTIVQFSFGDGFAGSAKIAILSSKLLKDKGHQVYLFVSENSLTEKRAGEYGLNYFSLNDKKKYKILFSEIEDIILKLHADIIIGHHSLDRKIGISLKRKHKTIINIAYRHNITKSVPVIGSFIYNNFTDYLISCSKGVELSLVKSGIKKNKIKTIYNGISIPENLNEISGNKIREGIPAGKKVLGLSTWFHKERKGFDILFKAYSTLPDEYILLLVGIPGDQKKEVLEYAKEFGIKPERIIMPGYVENIWEYYKAMDFFLLPSRSEGFSLALLEAAAAGLPIIASDIPGNNEFIEDGINGLLFKVSEPDKLRNRIIELSSNPSEARNIAQKGKDKVLNNFSINHYSDNLNNFLSGILAQKSRG